MRSGSCKNDASPKVERRGLGDYVSISVLFSDGERGRNRTYNLLIKSSGSRILQDYYYLP
jgi:hypothetical protein